MKRSAPISQKLDGCGSRFTHPQFPSFFSWGISIESALSIGIAKHVLLAVAIILAVGTFSGLLAQKLKVPDMVVFLLVGMQIGSGMLGLINIKTDSALNQIVLIFNSSYILFDGGASLRLNVLKEV